MKPRSDLLLHAEHLWVKVLGGDEALVGVSNFAAEQLGEVVFVDCPKPGAGIVQGVSFGVIESSKVVSDLIAPVTGTVIETNAELADSAALINSDPQGAGWILRVRLAAPDELTTLCSAEQYRRQLGDSR